METTLKGVRQNKHPEVIYQYRKGFDQIEKATYQQTKSEVEDLCEGFKESKC